MGGYFRYSLWVPQNKSEKKSAITPLSIKVGDLITSAYSGARLPNGARMNQADLAKRAGMSPVTVQKKLSGKAPITATDLVLLAGAIPNAEAGDILETAVTQLGGYETLLSVARGNNVTKLPRPNTADEFDNYEKGSRAAHPKTDESTAPDE
jgi:Helix-turn-helix.